MVFSEIDRSRIDDCLYYLLEANETYKGIVEIHPYDALFESEEGKEAEEHNAEVTSKTVGSLQKAVAALKRIIKNIMDSIKNFIQEICMSGEEFRRYQEIRKAIQENPEMKNVKVTVKDFRAIEKYYDDMIKEVEEKIKDVELGKTAGLDEFMKNIATRIKDNGSEVTKILTLDAAMNACANFKDAAKVMNVVLKDNDAALDVLSSTLGKHDAKKYVKKVNMYATSSAISLRRLLSNLTQKKANSLAECVNNTLNKANSLLKGKINKDTIGLAKNLKKNEVTGKTIDDVAKIAGKSAKIAAKGGIKAAKDVVSDKISNKINEIGTKKSGIDIERRIKIF